MNPDFVDFVAALIAVDARFLVVGAHALAAHGVPRAMGRYKDLGDIEALGEDPTGAG